MAGEEVFALSRTRMMQFLEMYEEHLRRKGNTPSRTPPDPNDHQAPEVYIAVTPSAGISGHVVEPDVPGTGSGTGTGLGTDVSSGECGVYSRVETHLGQTLVYAGFSKTAYNVGPDDIPGDTVILIVRDKFGTWVALRLVEESGGDTPAASTQPRVAAYRWGTTGAGTSHVLSEPPETSNPWEFGPAEGDVMLLVLMSETDLPGTITPDAGWTILEQGHIETNKKYYWIGWRRAGVRTGGVIGHTFTTANAAIMNYYMLSVRDAGDVTLFSTAGNSLGAATVALMPLLSDIPAGSVLVSWFTQNDFAPATVLNKSIYGDRLLGEPTVPLNIYSNLSVRHNVVLPSGEMPVFQLGAIAGPGADSYRAALIVIPPE